MITAIFITALLVLISFETYRQIPKVSEVGASGIFNEEEIKSQAEEVIHLFEQDDFEGLYNCSSPIMQESLTGEKLESWKGAKANLAPEWGEFQSLKYLYTAESKSKDTYRASVQIAASYEKIEVTYSITFDESMKLAGFYMK